MCLRSRVDGRFFVSNMARLLNAILINHALQFVKQNKRNTGFISLVLLLYAVTISLPIENFLWTLGSRSLMKCIPCGKPFNSGKEFKLTEKFVRRLSIALLTLSSGTYRFPGINYKDKPLNNGTEYFNHRLKSNGRFWIVLSENVR